MKKIPMEGWVMVLILFGYALNECWPLFNSQYRVYTFLDGKTSFTLSDQNIAKGFTDSTLDAIHMACISLLIHKYIPKIAVFFYILSIYATLNLFLYWYNYCQSPWPFYLMWAGLLAATIRLWPRVYRLRKV